MKGWVLTVELQVAVNRLFLWFSLRVGAVWRGLICALQYRVGAVLEIKRSGI